MKFVNISLIIILFLVFGMSPVFGKALTLKDSIEIAKEKNLYVIAAKARVRAAEGVVGQAFSKFLPQVNLEAGAGRSYQEQPVFRAADFGIPVTFEGTILPDKPFKMTSYQASLTQTLFTGWKVESGHEMAKKNFEISREDLRRAIQDLVYDVTVAYYGVLKAKKFVELSEESLNRAKSHLEQVNIMLGAGTVTKSDVLRSEVLVANSEITLTKARSALEIAKNNFNNAVGRGLNEKVEISEEEFAEEEFTIADYEKFLEEAYKERPDWRQFLLSKDIGKNEIVFAQSGYFPSIYLYGSYGRNRSEFEDVGRTDDLYSWSTVVLGSWNIFDGFSTQNKIKEAEAKLNAVKADEELVKNGIALEVKDACFNLNTAQEIIKMAKKTLELAEENYRISELRYNAGVGTNIEVLDAQTALTQAKLGYLEAQYDHEIAKARINKVIGKDPSEKVEIEEEKLVTIVGVVKYVPIEGGFIGLIDDAGNKYDLLGEKVAEIKEVIGEDKTKRIRIIGRPKRAIITIHMWGTPFEVVDYQWE